LFGTGADSDGQRYEQFRDVWMRILAATYGNVPDTDEYRIIYEPWGFAPADVTSSVHAWHGDADETIHLVTAVVGRMPRATLTVYSGEAHYLSSSHHPEMLDVLTGWARA
jgi:hypothetical protein